MFRGSLSIVSIVLFQLVIFNGIRNGKIKNKTCQAQCSYVTYKLLLAIGSDLFFVLLLIKGSGLHTLHYLDSCLGMSKVKVTSALDFIQVV